MKSLIMLTFLLAVSSAFADEKMQMNYKDEDVTNIIQKYSKAFSQKFIVDSGVRGKVSIFIQEPVGKEEAFNQLSSALALNGFAISKQGDTMIVKAARHIQRSLIEVSANLPAIKPERMYTWIATLKNSTSDEVNKNLRILSSVDGEILSDPRVNQLIITDWVTNINRIAEVLKVYDQKVVKK